VCVYVGYTSKTPEERYQQHITDYINKIGYHLASRVVLKYGIKKNGLRSKKYENYNPIATQKEAEAIESNLLKNCTREGTASGRGDMAITVLENVKVSKSINQKMELCSIH